MAFKYTKGQRVQMTRFGLRKQYAGVQRRKDESTWGTFVAYDGPSFEKGRKPRAHIIWYTGKKFPPSYPQVTRLDYIEPLGTPR